MSSVPAEIAGIGSTAQALRVSPGFDPLKAQVGPDEYFVLSRIDGVQTLRDVLLGTGLPVDRGLAIVTKLRSIGAVLLPGETSAPMPASAGPSKPSTPRSSATTTPTGPITPPSGIPIIARTKTPATPLGSSKPPARATPPPPAPPNDDDAPTNVRAGSVPRLPPRLPATDVQIDPPTLVRTEATREAEIAVVLPNITEEEQRALSEPAELALGERLRVLAMARLLDSRDPYALLGVPQGAEAKVLKRAYFLLSKEIHPDRYYGKQLGSFGERMNVVFEAVSRAYAKLTNPEKPRVSGAHHPVTAEQPQTPQEYAAELFERACSLEVSGDALGAMKLFAAAVRIDAQTRYLRRAASCALAAGQPKSALEYAKKAQTQSPDDPSSARLLAAAFRAAGRLADAEEVLVMAMALKSENDVLGAELRNDLAEVRRMMSS